jgi:hypothetical protein
MELDIRSTTTADLSGVPNFTVNPQSTQGAGGNGETYYDNPNFTRWYGYYKSIPELKTPLNALATWCLGQGYTCQNSMDKVILDHISGAGEDTFLSVLWQSIVVMKFNGDFYAEIIRDDVGIQNLKPLDPASMRTVFNEKGKIIRYEQRSKTPGQEPKKYKPEEIFHRMNDRIADETHGTSICEAVQWCIDARNEALADKRRTEHLSTIRVMEVDEDDPVKLATLKTQYATAIKNGTVLLVPKGTGAISDFVAPASDKIAWIQYLESFFYQALGVPKVILGGTAENTQASAQISVIVWEPTFLREVTELEQDIWNQLGIKISINRQPSLMDKMQSTESKDPNQLNSMTTASGK